MNTMEAIFKIEDKAKRLEALLLYAGSLKVKAELAKRPDGSYSENTLAVLIFDKEKQKSINKTRTWGIFVAAAFIMVMFIAAVLLMVKLVSG